MSVVVSLLHWAIINVNNLFMEADFNSIFFRSSSFFCQLPFTFTLTAACVGDSFFSAFIHTVLRLKRKCLYSIKSKQKSEQRMKDASGSEQHKTEAIPYDSFDLLHNFFSVEVGKQQVSFVLLPSRLRKTCWFFSNTVRKFDFTPSGIVLCTRNSACHSLGWITIFHFSAFENMKNQKANNVILLMKGRERNQIMKGGKRNWFNADSIVLVTQFYVI